jgi:hypothetical protein
MRSLDAAVWSDEQAVRAGGFMLPARFRFAWASSKTLRNAHEVLIDGIFIY